MVLLRFAFVEGKRKSRHLVEGEVKWQYKPVLELSWYPMQLLDWAGPWESSQVSMKWLDCYTTKSFNVNQPRKRHAFRQGGFLHLRQSLKWFDMFADNAPWICAPFLPKGVCGLHVVICITVNSFLCLDPILHIFSSSSYSSVQVVINPWENLKRRKKNGRNYNQFCCNRSQDVNQSSLLSSFLICFSFTLPL